MVRALHEAGIEVILDVVYNHTAEGNHLGPDAVVPGHRQPGVLPAGRGRQAVLHGLHRHREHPQRPAPAVAAADHGLAALLGHRDARRRLPLRPRLDPGPRVPRRRPAVGVLRPRPPGPGRQPGQADRRAVGRRRRAATRSATSRRCGPSGTASTATPSATSGAARPATIGEFASRITGSSDLYQHSGRRPVASINFVTAHDGFTLHDLVSYNEKHNEANGEDNNDGESHNRSWNCGVEGPTDDPEILAAARPAAAQLHRHADAQPGRADAAARRRAGPHPGRQQQRLLPGLRAHLDRLGRTSTRACSSSPRRSPSCAREHPTFRRRRFFHGRPVRRGEGDPVPDIDWLTPAGEQMDDDDWDGGYAKSLAVYLNGHGIRETDERGEYVVDDHFYLAFNASRRADRVHACPATTTPQALDDGPRHRRDGRGRAGRASSPARR